MPKLHLVGITPDHRGLVLSEHARAKRGDMVLEIDERLIEAIEKAQRLRTQDEGGRLESNALPSKQLDDSNGEGEVRPRLTPREIQQRLRAGESITAIARSSGTDEAWIRRFAQPVLAEQAVVIGQARTLKVTKRGVGPSAAPLGPAVAANVIDRGASLTLPEIEAGWGAYQRPDGGWHVRFTFPLRGRRQTAEWELDVAGGELTPRNKLATELGWREPGQKLTQPKAAAKAPVAKKPPVKKPAAAPEAEAEAEAVDHSVQELPLADGPAPLAPDEVRGLSLPKPSKSPAVKRAAAAVTESPSVVAVPSPAEPSPKESSPKQTSPTEASTAPTDLDVVEVVVDLRPLDEDAARQPAPIGSPPAPQGGPPAA